MTQPCLLNPNHQEKFFTLEGELSSKMSFFRSCRNTTFSRCVVYFPNADLPICQLAQVHPTTNLASQLSFRLSCSLNLPKQPKLHNIPKRLQTVLPVNLLPLRICSSSGFPSRKCANAFAWQLSPWTPFQTQNRCKSSWCCPKPLAETSCSKIQCRLRLHRREDWWRSGDNFVADEVMVVKCPMRFTIKARAIDDIQKSVATSLPSHEGRIPNRHPEWPTHPLSPLQTLSAVLLLYSYCVYCVHGKLPARWREWLRTTDYRLWTTDCSPRTLDC